MARAPDRAALFCVALFLAAGRGEAGEPGEDTPVPGLRARTLARTALAGTKGAALVIGKPADWVGEGLIRTGDGLERVAPAAWTLRAGGRALKHFLGYETLRRTSLELTLGGAVTLDQELHLPSWMPGWVPSSVDRFANISGGVGLWTGSAEYWEQAVKKGRPWDVHFQFRTGLETFLGGAGWSNLGKVYRSARLPWVNVYADQRAYGATVGLNYGPLPVSSVGVGEVTGGEGQYRRGPYGGVGGSIPGLPSLALGPVRAYAGYGVTFYYPPLEPLSQAVRPAAQALRHPVEAGRGVLAAMSRVLRHPGEHARSAYRGIRHGVPAGVRKIGASLRALGAASAPQGK